MANIAVLGATGGTGRQIVAQALAAGHNVKAFVRDRKSLTAEDSRLEVVEGDVHDETALRTATNGVDAVLSALGSREMQKPTTVYSDGVAKTVSAMKSNGVRRLVAISAIPVSPEKSPIDRYLVHPLLYQFFGGGYADLERMEKFLIQAEVDWTVFRPPALSNGSFGIYGLVLPRAKLAQAMLDAIDDSTTHRRIIAIAG